MNKSDPRIVAKHFTRQAHLQLREIYIHGGKSFDTALIELDGDKLKTAYDALGKALDALGVPRLKPEHCKHPQELREDLNSSVARCNACGRLHAMVATRSGASRKWVDADDTRVAFGKLFTDAVLEGERERIQARMENADG